MSRNVTAILSDLSHAIISSRSKEAASLTVELVQAYEPELVDDLSPTFIYVFGKQDGSMPTKIGVSACAEDRIAALQIGSPEPLIIFHTIQVPTRSLAFAIERTFKQAMSTFQAHGEWFRLTPIACFYILNGIIRDLQCLRRER